MTEHGVHWITLDPIWEGGESVIKRGLPRDQVSPIWQLLLIGDGSPTRHLQLLTGESIQVEVIDMSAIGMDSDKAPHLINEISGPRLRRQVWLKTGTGQKLAYATSWWEKNKVEEYLKNENVSIWESLTRSRIELYRDIRCIQYGNSPVLETEFGQPGPFWARYYMFWHGGQPLTLIHEVFSPYLEEYLGKSRMTFGGA